MATTYNDTQIAVIDASGNISVIYPRTKASLVSVDSGKYGGSSNTTVLQTALNNLSTGLGNKVDLSVIYPVGSVYMTTNTTVPSNFPGTWVEIDAGYFLKAVGSGNTAGSTANAGNTGAASGNTGSTTLTAAQSGLPSHTHTWSSGGRGIVVASNGLPLVQFTNSGSGVLAYVPDDYCATGASGGSNASQGHTHTLNSHTHTAGNPASYGVHVFKRTK